MTEFNILLYYYYTKIINTNELWKQHKEFCSKYDLKGRIIIAKEGLNGTLSGPTEDCDKYMNFIKNNPLFTDIEFKIDTYHKHVFPKMSIKIKEEIIKIGEDVDPTIKTGIHLTPCEFKKKMRETESIIVDMRSDYEYKVGKFKNALTFDIDKMYRFPDKFENHQLFNDNNKDKAILTYCTGGIKCEKASSYFLSKGFKNVYQLHGGIIKYGFEENGEDFDGKCYVFDNRITKEVNTVNPCIISKCYICDDLCDIMINCMNTVCNRHTTICKECYENMGYCCSIKCKNSIKKIDQYPEYYM